MSTKTGDKPKSTMQDQSSPLAIPEGDVLIKKIAGSEGAHPLLGRVYNGRVYTVTFTEAVRLTEGQSPDFRAVYPDDQKRLNEARAKEAQPQKA